MLLRIWMILVLAIYPAMVVWMPVSNCSSGACSMGALEIADGTAGATAAQPGCCSRSAPIAATVARTCCASKAAADQRAAPMQGGCCATRGPIGSLVRAGADDSCCPFAGYCRGPCRSTPGSPIAPVRRDHQSSTTHTFAISGSYPLLVAESVPQDRRVNWVAPQPPTVSSRLAIICLRTI